MAMLRWGCNQSGGMSHRREMVVDGDLLSDFVFHGWIELALHKVSHVATWASD